MKYIIAVKVDNKGEIYEFETKEQRKDFYNSINGAPHVTDIAFSEYDETLKTKQLTEYKTKEIDPMYNFTQFLFIVLAMVHSWYGNDVFPILCLICLNTIADRYFSWKSK